MIAPDATRPKVAIVHLGRATALGERARVASWVGLATAAGFDPIPLALLSGTPTPAHLVAATLPIIRGRAVPEAATWSPATALRRLRTLAPVAVVCVTGRAWHPAIADGPWVTVLDHVDNLGDSYGERAHLARSRSRRFVYAALARSARRFESRAVLLGVPRVAAGWSDARALGATWVPNVVDPPPRSRPEPHGRGAVDVCFVGTLSYPPNVEALRVLGGAWPAIRRIRPGATALIAGAGPGREVADLARRHGWDLAPDFAGIDDVFARSRLAVAPLVTASGIQNKVLEAAAHGVAQVVTAAALAGFAPGFPARTVPPADGPALAASVTDLLADAGGRRDLADRASRVVRDRYVAQCWTSVVVDIFG